MNSTLVILQRLAVWLIVTKSFYSYDLLIFIEAIGTDNSVISSVVSVTKDVSSGTERIGRIRYHHFNQHLITGKITDGRNLKILKDTTEPPQLHCSDVLMVGVGTAMSVEDYDKLAKRIATLTESLSLVVIVLDHNLGGFVKTSPNRYADLANAIQKQLYKGLIPICNSSVVEKDVYHSKSSSSIIAETKTILQEKEKGPQQQSRGASFFIGGHSASGQAALEAAQKELYDFTPRGFVGLDPFDVSDKTMDFDSPLEFPTLDWGFEETTCSVQVKKAALAVYGLSSPESGRVLYSINNNKNDGMNHCVFTDDGCGVGFVKVCPTEERFEWVLDSVAKSFLSFVNALKSVEEIPFQKENFELSSTLSGDVFLFVNDDRDGEGINNTDCYNAPADTTLAEDTVSRNAVDSTDPTDTTLGNSGSYSARHDKLNIRIVNLVVGCVFSLFLI
eukprot:jgi/Psemu1/16621/gm1.16621_g